MAEELVWIHKQKCMLSKNDQGEIFGSCLMYLTAAAVRLDNGI